MAVNGYQALTIPLGDEEQWTLARDPQTNVYLGGASGLFAKYSSDAILIWTTNYGQMPVGMLVDAVGNRFLGFADGSVARVAAEASPQPGSSAAAGDFRRAAVPNPVPRGQRVVFRCRHRDTAATVLVAAQRNQSSECDHLQPCLQFSRTVRRWRLYGGDGRSPRKGCG